MLIRFGKISMADLLSEIEGMYKELEPLGKSRDYFNEVISKIELFTIAAQYNNIINAKGKPNYDAVVSRAKETIRGYL